MPELGMMIVERQQMNGDFERALRGGLHLLLIVDPVLCPSLPAHRDRLEHLLRVVMLISKIISRAQAKKASISEEVREIIPMLAAVYIPYLYHLLVNYGKRTLCSTRLCDTATRKS